ncbi:hypothetical protein ERO13_D08G019400v2 [Gossypium hirsutum]|uniref:Heavy metal-associated isoprenylated plant protein 47 n=1 Tax=Gossypium hirsutum TaxID=3635 RepID=A0ABM3AKE2_GOSHI|nr:heavy metal-associated isoprenylated plant protein 47-like [Gossypium hirsutum]KAG4132228.1 hypothetical protein ERO13_D08G019400v2 [Gossypium hirsutum]
MKQKVVLKVAMNCEKCRSEALQVAAGQAGVDSVALDGKEKEKVVVIGDFDAVKLTNNLRKKVGAAEILTLGKHN